MSDKTSSLSHTLAQMRQSFDQSFAEKPQPETTPGEPYILIGVSKARLAIKTSEVLSIESHKPVLSLPGHSNFFIGLTGIKGKLIPLYNLKSILGHESERKDELCHWLAVVGGTSPLALAFQNFEGSVRIPESDVFMPSEKQRNTREAFRLASQVISVLDIQSLISEISPRGN